MKPMETHRLVLRAWKPEDITPFSAMNQDPRVMEYFPSLMTEAQTATFMNQIMERMDKQGFGLFACEVKATGEMIGYVGLNVPAFTAHFTPCIEIGWRLAHAHWGKGYATEAAQYVLAKASADWQLRDIVSFTVPHNLRSRRVMEKLGMTHHPADDFDHPSLDPSHPLSRHVLYRIKLAA